MQNWRQRKLIRRRSTAHLELPLVQRARASTRLPLPQKQARAVALCDSRELAQTACTQATASTREVLKREERHRGQKRGKRRKSPAGWQFRKSHFAAKARRKPSRQPPKHFSPSHFPTASCTPRKPHMSRVFIIRLLPLQPLQNSPRIQRRDRLALKPTKFYRPQGDRTDNS